jgi:hypothetical protein
MIHLRKVPARIGLLSLNRAGAILSVPQPCRWSGVVILSFGACPW